MIKIDQRLILPFDLKSLPNIMVVKNNELPVKFKLFIHDISHPVYLTFSLIQALEKSTKANF